MTAEQIIESQKKLPCIYNCPKCKDKKVFKNMLDVIEKCREC